MPKESMLQFHTYVVDEIRFKKLPALDAPHQFQLHPHFKRTTSVLENAQYNVTLTVEISSSETAPAPFELFISLTGRFSLLEADALAPETKAAILKNNTAAILFPYLRAAVSSVISSANLPALLLPVMSFQDEGSEDTM